MIRHSLKERMVYGVGGWFARLQYDWRTAADEVAQGTHSKIPPCCIAFFVVEWAPWVLAYGRNMPHPHEAELLRAGFHSIEHAKSGKPPQYVPCPDCLRDKRFVEIHSCTTACASERGGSYFGKAED
jgi:hypothetical protein